MILSFIFAMTDDRVIGLNNSLPWHISDDLKRFKRITSGHPIIMGRKTLESFGKPLPGRQNIVISRNSTYKVEGAVVVHSVEEALQMPGPESEEVFIIGGAEIFKKTLPLVQKIYMTLIHKKFEGDTFFPEFDLQKDFDVIEESHHQTPPPDIIPYSYITAVRK